VGVTELVFERRKFEKFLQTLNISKTGGPISAKFSGLLSLKELSLRLRLVRVQILGVEGRKLAKNGIPGRRWVTTNGALIF